MIEKPKPYLYSFQFYCLCVGLVLLLFSTKDNLFKYIQKERVNYSIKQVSNSCLNKIIPPKPFGKFNVARAFPKEALEMGKEGAISVKVNIDTNGNVINSESQYSEDNIIFVSNSEKIAKKILFRPALVNCKPVPSEYKFNLKFMMD